MFWNVLRFITSTWLILSLYQFKKNVKKLMKIRKYFISHRVNQQSYVFWKKKNLKWENRIAGILWIEKWFEKWRIGISDYDIYLELLFKGFHYLSWNLARSEQSIFHRISSLIYPKISFFHRWIYYRPSPLDLLFWGDKVLLESTVSSI